jgi:pimeloyl-ACP methyl ester carboxylesterase
MAGEAVVLLHASGSSPRQWSALAGRVAAGLHMHAVVPDLEGTRTLDAEVDRVCRAISLDNGVHLVGHSYGGAVAVKAALSGRLDVRSLTVYEPSLFAFLDDPGASPKVVGREITRLFETGDAEASARLYVDYWTSGGEFDRMPPEKRARMVQRMDSVVNCFAALFHDAARPADLARLAIPALVLSGRKSPSPSQDLCEIVAGSLPQARLHHFATLGHMGPVTDAASVNAVVEEFLRDVAMARKPERRAA